MTTDWPNQVYAISELRRLIAAGARRICITSPTGTGKSRIVQRIVEWGESTLILTNRTMLMEQWATGLDDAGHPFGIKASGYAPTIDSNVQLGMIQTIESRWSKGDEELPDASIVILDEAHNETGERICKVLGEYLNRFATVILVTATPIGIGHMADELITACVTSDARRFGALVPAMTFAPDEPAIESMKKTAKGMIQFKDEFKEVMLKVIFGRCIEHYRRLNPEQKPTILFAPGVDESRWFCEQFNESGIPWSHIDSKQIILNGNTFPATTDNRKILADASRTGLTKGVSNRFVLREGIDFPWLEHCIFACTFGSVKSYLQAGGRLLRQHYVDGTPRLTTVTVQDHGGNFWRHDSLNADRECSLEDTDKKLEEKHDELYRTKAAPEPIVCPKCFKVRTSGAVCPHCQHMYEGRRRIVIQTDGHLREVKGDIYRPRRVNNTPESHKAWQNCYFRCLKSGMTFNQARGLFQRENGGTVPGTEFPLVPKNESDWSLRVQDVPRHRLTPYAPKVNAERNEEPIASTPTTKQQPLFS